jgi:hypothetical protein
MKEIKGKEVEVCTRPKKKKKKKRDKDLLQYFMRKEKRKAKLGKEQKEDMALLLKEKGKENK